MRTSVNYFLGFLAVMALALPAFARTDEMTLHLDKATKVGMTQLQPGDYQVKADESKKDLKVMKGDAIVADVPGHWVDLSKKPDYDQSVVDSKGLTQVEFGGQLRSFVIG